MHIHLLMGSVQLLLTEFVHPTFVFSEENYITQSRQLECAYHVLRLVCGGNDGDYHHWLVT